MNWKSRIIATAGEMSTSSVCQQVREGELPLEMTECSVLGS